jgi:SynChlorMet cassette protein ScmC
LPRRLNSWESLRARRFKMTSAPSLELADGSAFGIVPADPDAECIVMRVAAAMDLRPAPLPNRRVIVRTGDRAVTAGTDPGTIVCALGSDLAEDPALFLIQVARSIARDVENRGGVLVHGALARRDDAGVILAGPSGIGKTTASRRLKPPWFSLCDDSTLVVRDQNGDFWGHPWPTWSRFYAGGPAGTWTVARAVRLRAICFLGWAQRDTAERLGAADASVHLFDSTRPTWPLPSIDGNPADVRADHSQRFDRACALALAVPCFVLRLSPDGAFWQQLDGILDGRAPT